LKANKTHLQDLQTAHNEYSAELVAMKTHLERAEDKAKDVEAKSKMIHQRAEMVSLNSKLYRELSRLLD
jgi:intracellular protein transport protein USO1